MTKATVRSVEYGDRKITFELSRAETQRLRITVAPEGTVAVRAPRHATDETIDSRVVRRGRWITKQQDEIAELHKLRCPKRFVSGETHRYLGRQYRLRVRKSDKPSVKLKGGFYEVQVADPHDVGLVQNHLDRWFRDQARRVFGVLVRQWIENSNLRGIDLPPITIRSMKNRWGSCAAGGRISLNPMLIHVPRPCIEYVIVHELCHQIHHHHGPDFYGLLGKVLPDWKARRVRLNHCEI